MSSLPNIVKNILNPTPVVSSSSIPPSPSVAPLIAHSDEHVKDKEEKETEVEVEESEDEDSDDESLAEEIQRLKTEKVCLEEELKVLKKDKLEMQEKEKEFVKREKEIDRKTKSMSEYDSYLIQHKKEVLDLLQTEKAQMTTIITGSMNALTSSMLQLLNAHNAITIGRPKPEVVEHVVATPTQTQKAEAVIVIDTPNTPSVSSHMQEVNQETLKRNMTPPTSPKAKKRKTTNIPVRMPQGWGDEKKWKKHMEDIMWEEYNKCAKK